MAGKALKLAILTVLVLPLVGAAPSQKGAPPPSEGLEATAVIIGDPIEYALSLKREGRLKKARMILEKAIEADPKNWRAHHILGWICLDMGDKKKAVHHLRRAVYLGPPCSEEVNLDARTINRLLSGRRAPGLLLPFRPSATVEFLQMMMPAILLSSLGEQAGLGEREKGLLFGLGLLFGKVAKRLKPFEEELRKHGMALVFAYRAMDWGTMASELEAIGDIFLKAAQGARGTEEGRLLEAFARGIRRAASYVARQDFEGAGRVLNQEIIPVLERISRRMMKQAKALARRARKEMLRWRRQFEEWARFQQILNLPPVSPMVPYSPVGVRIRE